jgi:hypothetical protein
MRGKSIAIAATVVAALALPVAATGHPFTSHGLFSGGKFSGEEMPTLDYDVGVSDTLMRSYYQGGSPPTEYAKDDMRFLDFSPRPAATLARANSDIAFQGKVAIQGTFQGFRFIDIRNPYRLREIFAFEDCSGEGGQGDIVVYGDIMTRSWDAPAQAGRTCDGKPVPVGWEGLHVFDISDLEDPELVAEVRTRCGSHTATGVPDPRNKRLLVYNTPSYSATNCVNDPPAAGIQVVEVPLRSPENSRALQFEDAAPTIRCHDTGVILGKILRAACAGGDGIAVWTMDRRKGGSLDDPKLQYVRDMRNTGVPDFKVGHSAAWSNDGETLIIGHEPDGGVRARCQPTGTVFADPTANYTVQTDDMKSLFFLDSDTGATRATWTLPRDQTKFENCTVHNYNVVPTDKRDVLVQGSYQSGLGIIDFSNLRRIREVAYADPIPLSETTNPNGTPAQLGGDWSTHWYNGTVYQSDISRGFLSWKHTDDTFRGDEYLSRLNPQTQEYTTSKGHGRR